MLFQKVFYNNVKKIRDFYEILFLLFILIGEWISIGAFDEFKKSVPKQFNA